jgi:hypothetical protein
VFPIVEPLGNERDEFVRYASEQGIPNLSLEGEELQRELDMLKTHVGRASGSWRFLG